MGDSANALQQGLFTLEDLLPEPKLSETILRTLVNENNGVDL